MLKLEARSGPIDLETAAWKFRMDLRASDGCVVQASVPVLHLEAVRYDMYCEVVRSLEFQSLLLQVKRNGVEVVLASLPVGRFIE